MTFAGVLYYRSDYRKVLLTDDLYSELVHPEWSYRLLRVKTSLDNLGSGDHRIVYLADVREVKIPRTDARRYYEEETKRRRFRECHVDDYDSAKANFVSEWEELSLDLPRRDDIVVITQRFTSDSTLRR